MKKTVKLWMRFLGFIVFGCLSALSVHAGTKIAILDFELKDLTLKPGTPEEHRRTAALKPLLEQELKSAGYTLVNIDPQHQKQAEAGRGYLFDHHDAAAQLGRQFKADYVLVGRLHKPSFLFAYAMGHLVRVRDAHLVGDFISETKGPSLKLTRKVVESLTVKIDQVLDHRYTPPPPSNGD